MIDMERGEEGKQGDLQPQSDQIMTHYYILIYGYGILLNVGEPLALGATILGFIDSYKTFEAYTNA